MSNVYILYTTLTNIAHVFYSDFKIKTLNIGVRNSKLGEFFIFQPKLIWENKIKIMYSSSK